MGLCRDRVDATEMLIRAGADINALNHKNHSPLQIAVAKPSKHCVAALIKHDLCNVNLQVQLSHRLNPANTVLLRSLNMTCVTSTYRYSYHRKAEGNWVLVIALLTRLLTAVLYNLGSGSLLA